jgi:hypothetical protein
MANAIDQLDSGLTIGRAQLGMHGSQLGTINQQVHDGDTVTSLLDGTVGVPVWAWTPPRSASPFRATRDSFACRTRHGRRSSADPFASSLPAFSPPLAVDLQAL